jgi:hypothetical protein
MRVAGVRRFRYFRYWLTRLMFILSILGPGFITANVDNDAGGIYTYASPGAQFGYSILWTIIPMFNHEKLGSLGSFTFTTTSCTRKVD